MKLITEEQVQSVLNYLITRPYQEVFKGIEMITKLEDAPNAQQISKVSPTEDPQDTVFSVNTEYEVPVEVFVIKYSYYGLSSDEKVRALDTIKGWTSNEFERHDLPDTSK